jgi:hypothetical protein
MRRSLDGDEHQDAKVVGRAERTGLVVHDQAMGPGH